MKLLLLSFLVPILVNASSGDRRIEYSTCVAYCQYSNCPSSPTILSTSIPLYLTRWTCLDECRYNCMHQLTEDDIHQGKQLHQYHGKWPFWRLGGIQEPASVLFSLFNMWAHIQGARNLLKRVPQSHPMRFYYLAWSLTSINAWFWSSVFHTRDKSFTEKMDYFSAALAILYALYYTTIRLFHLYPQRQEHRLTTSTSRTSRDWKYLILTLTCSIAFIGHISYLTLLPRFDYSYNMTFNLAIGLLHNLLWILYSLPSSTISLIQIRRFQSRPKSYRPSFATKAGIFVLVTTAATALELLDFPPWGLIIDAHSLWHLVTAPIAYYWYGFLVEDSHDSSWKEQRP